MIAHTLDCSARMGIIKPQHKVMTMGRDYGLGVLRPLTIDRHNQFILQIMSHHNWDAFLSWAYTDLVYLMSQELEEETNKPSVSELVLSNPIILKEMRTTVQKMTAKQLKTQLAPQLFVYYRSHPEVRNNPIYIHQHQQVLRLIQKQQALYQQTGEMPVWQTDAMIPVVSKSELRQSGRRKSIQTLIKLIRSIETYYTDNNAAGAQHAPYVIDYKNKKLTEILYKQLNQTMLQNYKRQSDPQLKQAIQRMALEQSIERHMHFADPERRKERFSISSTAINKVNRMVEEAKPLIESAAVTKGTAVQPHEALSNPSGKQLIQALEPKDKLILLEKMVRFYVKPTEQANISLQERETQRRLKQSAYHIHQYDTIKKLELLLKPAIEQTRKSYAHKQIERLSKAYRKPKTAIESGFLVNLPIEQSNHIEHRNRTLINNKSHSMLIKQLQQLRSEEFSQSEAVNSFSDKRTLKVLKQLQTSLTLKRTAVKSRTINETEMSSEAMNSNKSTVNKLYPKLLTLRTLETLNVSKTNQVEHAKQLNKQNRTLINETSQTQLIKRLQHLRTEQFSQSETTNAMNDMRMLKVLKQLQTSLVRKRTEVKTRTLNVSKTNKFEQSNQYKKQNRELINNTSPTELIKRLQHLRTEQLAQSETTNVMNDMRMLEVLKQLQTSSKLKRTETFSDTQMLSETMNSILSTTKKPYPKLLMLRKAETLQVSNTNQVEQSNQFKKQNRILINNTNHKQLIKRLQHLRTEQLAQFEQEKLTQKTQQKTSQRMQMEVGRTLSDMRTLKVLKQLETRLTLKRTQVNHKTLNETEAYSEKIGSYKSMTKKLYPKLLTLRTVDALQVSKTNQVHLMSTASQIKNKNRTLINNTSQTQLIKRLQQLQTEQFAQLEQEKLTQKTQQETSQSKQIEFIGKSSDMRTLKVLKQLETRLTLKRTQVNHKTLNETEAYSEKIGSYKSTANKSYPKLLTLRTVEAVQESKTNQVHSLNTTSQIKNHNRTLINNTNQTQLIKRLQQLRTEQLAQLEQEKLSLQTQQQTSQRMQMEVAKTLSDKRTIKVLKHLQTSLTLKRTQVKQNTFNKTEVLSESIGSFKVAANERYPKLLTLRTAEALQEPKTNQVHSLNTTSQIKNHNRTVINNTSQTQLIKHLQHLRTEQRLQMEVAKTVSDMRTLKVLKQLQTSLTLKRTQVKRNTFNEAEVSSESIGSFKVVANKRYPKLLTLRTVEALQISKTNQVHPVNTAIQLNSQNRTLINNTSQTKLIEHLQQLRTEQLSQLEQEKLAQTSQQTLQQKTSQHMQMEVAKIVSDMRTLKVLKQLQTNLVLKRTQANFNTLNETKVSSETIGSFKVAANKRYPKLQTLRTVEALQVSKTNQVHLMNTASQIKNQNRSVINKTSQAQLIKRIQQSRTLVLPNQQFKQQTIIQESVKEVVRSAQAILEKQQTQKQTAQTTQTFQNPQHVTEPQSNLSDNGKMPAFIDVDLIADQIIEKVLNKLERERRRRGM